MSDISELYLRADKRYKDCLEDFKKNPSTKLAFDLEEHFTFFLQVKDLMEKSLLSKRKIYIIESTSQKDIYTNTQEANTLVEYLSLSGIDHISYSVKNAKEFEDACKKISKDILQCKQDCSSTDHCVFTPILHLSMHGSKEGVAFTDDSITWEMLDENIRIMLQQAKYELEKYLSPLILCLSVCKGTSFYEKYASNGNPCFRIMISTKYSIAWKDAAIGFLVFYHQFVNKQQTIHVAIEKMKMASSHDFFEVFTDPRLQIMS